MPVINPFEEFLKLNDVFCECGVDYALCGGIAMAAHGFVRATEDIDLLVEAESLPRIRSIAAGLGYRLTGPELEFKSGTKLIRLLKSFPGMECYLVLDLIVVDAHNRAAWESRQTIEMPAGTIRVISAEALKSMKRESGRPQDLVDIERLEKGPDESGHAA